MKTFILIALVLCCSCASTNTKRWQHLSARPDAIQTDSLGVSNERLRPDRMWFVVFVAGAVYIGTENLE